MMTAQFFSGASLFALLIVDICCLPVKKGFYPSASNNNAYLSSISSSSGPGFGASHTNNNAAPTAGAQRAPAAYLSSISSSSGPGFGAGAALYSGAGDAFQSGAGGALHSGAGGALHSGAGGALHSGAGGALQPYSGDMNWAVAPLSTFSAGDERSAGAYGGGSSGSIYPPPPAYQAGEMSNLEQAFEHGRYETETEDQGFYPSPMQASAGQAFTSQPQPGPSMGGYWGQYPYYDYMFITGQHPPGTYTHFSASNERGQDNWEDAHYRRYYPAQDTPAVPQRFEDPRPAVKAPHGKGGAAAGKGGRY